MSETVEAAADRLLAAFAAHDRDAYFACFAPDATFLFHTTDRVLGSRAEYEEEWARWEADGFRVLSCQTVDRRIDMITPDVAILTHRVTTQLDGSDAPERERETIVFRREPTGEWRAVHEHLSPDPDGRA